MDIKPILLLDFDGVIIVPEYYRAPKSSCINQLNRIIDITNCDIVISSSWQILNDIDTLNNLLNKWGCNIKIHDLTGGHSKIPPILGDDFDLWKDNDHKLNGREYLIIDYVNKNNIKNWCAIDDSIRESHRMVNVHPMIGIDKSAADRVIKWLNQ